MSRPPSQAVIEAVERAMLGHVLCDCLTDSATRAEMRGHIHVEVARAAEAAALRAAADDYFNASSGTKARPHARSWLRARANKLTDTEDRSK